LSNRYYFHPRFVVSTSRFSCHKAFPDLFCYSSDHSGSSQVHRMALFSGRGDSLGWNYVHPPKEFRVVPNILLHIRTYPSVSWRSRQASPFFCSPFSFLIPYSWYSFFSAGQLLLPVFQSHFQFTVVSLCIELEELLQHFI
jgi:hypothetical protein